MTDILIRPYGARDLDAVVRLSLRAWEPVFASLKQAMDPAVYDAFYPEGWRKSQRESVEAVLADEAKHVWVAVEDDTPVGFVAASLHPESSLGEIYMIAVDPAHQQTGVASLLTGHALDWLRSAGMTVAMVETGGDPGHAPARRTYEKAGFRPLPLVRYFRKL